MSRHPTHLVPVAAARHHVRAAVDCGAHVVEVKREGKVGQVRPAGAVCRIEALGSHGNGNTSGRPHSGVRDLLRLDIVLELGGVWRVARAAGGARSPPASSDDAAVALHRRGERSGRGVSAAHQSAPARAYSAAPMWWIGPTTRTEHDSTRNPQPARHKGPTGKRTRSTQMSLQGWATERRLKGGPRA
jgi:hypothetical protein